jgi:hypothetical protein
METEESNQHTEPGNTPRGTSAKPKLPGEEGAIVQGAKQTDQLDKLKPENGDKKAPNKAGSPPLKQAGGKSK